MSVKGKVKRANKRIKELENKILKLEQLNKQYQFITIKREDEELKIIKDDFIKMILNERKPLEHNCCRMTISRAQLETMKNARLDIERNYFCGNNIDFILKV